MAEQHEQEECNLPAVPVSEEDEQTPGYKPPAQKTLDEIQKLDAEDESLIKYKQTLLGGTTLSNVTDEGGPNVLVKRLIIDMTGGPKMELDLTKDLGQLKKHPFIFKVSTNYCVKICFRVQREIVAGLRYSQTSYRAGIPVDKMNCMVGSYGPRNEEHMFTSHSDETPGKLAKGRYTVKSKFSDDDKNIYLEWQWSFELKSDFKKESS